MDRTDLGTLPLVVLGHGAAEGRVLARRPLDWHGMPGLAWTLDVELPDGSVAHGIQVGAETPTFLDPRVAVRRTRSRVPD